MFILSRLVLSERRSTEPKAGGSNPSRRVAKVIEKELTTSSKLINKSENQNLVSGLFFALESDLDLKLIIKKSAVTAGAHQGSNKGISPTRLLVQEAL